MKAGRIGTLIFWLIVLVSLAGVIPDPMGQMLPRLGGMILFFHMIEVALLFTVFRERTQPSAKDILPVLVYGAFYLKPKLDAAREA